MSLRELLRVPSGGPVDLTEIDPSSTPGLPAGAGKHPKRWAGERLARHRPVVRKVVKAGVSPLAVDQLDEPCRPRSAVEVVRAQRGDLAQRLGVSANKGVLVQDVKPGSFAEDIGLAKGQVILEVNRQAVNNEDDFKRVTSQLKSGQDVVFLVHSGRGATGGAVFLGGTLP